MAAQTPHRLLSSLLLLCCAMAGSAGATAPDPALEAQLLRLATCEDSWLEWKADRPRLQRFATALHAQFSAEPKSPAMKPNRPTRLMGLAVTQLFPDSVGMGLGFSVMLQADLQQARQRFEAQLGRPLSCETGDGMVACELPLGEKKTAMLINGDKGRSPTSLLGCFYFYQQ